MAEGPQLVFRTWIERTKPKHSNKQKVLGRLCWLWRLACFDGFALDWDEWADANTQKSRWKLNDLLRYQLSPKKSNA